MSDAPVLIFEVDAAGNGDSGAMLRRSDLRLVGCMRQGARGKPNDLRNGSLSAVLVLRSLSPSRLLGWVRAVTGGDARLSPELLRQMLPENGDDGGWPLTRREFDVLRLLSEGEGTREIAVELNYSERTVKNVVHDLLAKLNCRTRAHAVAVATRRGLI